jgi:tyramine---L-glutamate ligase
MLSALVEDLQRVDGCEVWTMLDQHCPAPLGHVCHRLHGKPVETNEQFQELAHRTDATLIIAPETGGVLAQLGRAVLGCGGRLLGCTPAFVDLTADKKALGELWRLNGVPTPALIEPADYPGFPVVLKPRDGAGSEATFLIRDQQSWQRCWHEEVPRFSDPETLATGGPDYNRYIVQPFVHGHPASVSFLMGPGAMVPLVPATQELSKDGRLRYLGGRLPLAPDLAQRALRLAERALRVAAGATPQAVGYVGVDLILGADETGDRAIEINPRLTTSYLGLRRHFQGSLAQELLNVFSGRASGEMRWQAGSESWSVPLSPMPGAACKLV